MCYSCTVRSYVDIQLLVCLPPHERRVRIETDAFSCFRTGIRWIIVLALHSAVSLYVRYVSTVSVTGLETDCFYCFCVRSTTNYYVLFLTVSVS